MVEVHYQGRLGNKMFQYAFARLVAERLGYTLRVGPLPWFPATLEPVLGKEVYEPVIQVEEGLHSCPQTHGTFDEICARWAGSKIELMAHFEQSCFYLPHRQRIRQWYAIERQPHPKTAIHIRGTDWRYGTERELDYYKAAISLVDTKNAVIVTDDPEWSFVKAFGLPVVSSKRPKDDFLFLANAAQLVIGYSTFAWWAAFLSDGMIIQPEPVTGSRSLLQNPNFYLGVPDWVKVVVPGYWPW